MKKFRKSYSNVKWHEFSKKIKKRDDYKCLICYRKESETTLQVHHKHYISGLLPWEYALSDCLTLCKGCHAREHNKIEPTTDWTLISVDDLGGLDGICERNGCGAEIRYEHLIYHPNYGYKCVGSFCVEYLTQDDKNLSTEILRIYKRISEFIYKSSWEYGTAKSGASYIYTMHKHHKLRIYGQENTFAFQIILKQKGEKWYDYGEITKALNKNLVQVKELAFIVLMAKCSNSEKEKDLLRNIYIRTR